MEEVHGELRQEEVQDYLTFPEEQLIIAKRPHWVVLLEPIFLIVFLSLLINIGAFFVFTILFNSLILFTLLTLVIINLTTVVIAKLLVDTYFHIYIVTTRKILEVSSKPMFTHAVDDVFLDQVRTTEIDIKMNNLLQKFLNFGDVIIAFDRPSHDKEFTLKNIHNPKKTGEILIKELETLMYESPIWFEPRKKNHPAKLADDIQPKQSMSQGP